MTETRQEPRLLYPLRPSGDTASPPRSLPEEAAEDLQLRTLTGAMGGSSEEQHLILSTLTDLQTDAATIRYRQAIFADLTANPQLTSGLEELMPRIEELVSFRGLRQNQGLPFLESVWRLGELELYVSIMEDLSELLSDPQLQLQADGFTELRRRVEEKRADRRYVSLRKELPGLSAGIKEKASITLGINLDHHLRPVEAGIVSINADTYTPRNLLSRIFGGEAGFSTMTPLHSSPATDAEGRTLPLAPLFQELDSLIKSSAKRLRKPLQDYLYLHTGFLSALRTDFLFFLGGVRLYRRFQKAGLPVCIPQILPPDERRFHARGMYSPLLLLEGSGGNSDEEAAAGIVPSDIDFDDTGRLFVLTGPNRGGKTTFTRAVGLSHLLAQAGLFVPARDCSLSPATQLHTHFPRREQENSDAGRLGSEAHRLSALFEQLTPFSLVLLNESLTSTSPGEGVYLAMDILRGLRLAGVRAVFTTHYHDLASSAERINRETAGDSRVASLVAEAVHEEETDTARRTFRIVRREPDGSSYARDIARRYGIGYQQIREVLQRRGLI